MNQNAAAPVPRLTSLSHGGGCGCKIAPGVLSELLARFGPAASYPNLMVGTETADDAAVYKLNDEQALIATTDFFMPIVDDPYDFGRIAATNALSDVYAMGGTPIMALAIVGMPINVLPHSVIADILRGGESVCAEAGIPVAGGHSIDSVEPIYGLAAMGLVHPSVGNGRCARRRRADPGQGAGRGHPVRRAEEKPAGRGRLPRHDRHNHAAQPARRRVGGDGGVHAITDVTGFGLLGHALEMARGAGLTAHLRRAALPWLPGVQAYAADGVITGASGRNWASYGASVKLADDVTDVERALLTDPQTSGGLLVACAPEAAQAVLDLFRSQGFDKAAWLARWARARPRCGSAESRAGRAGARPDPAYLRRWPCSCTCRLICHSISAG
ncbi:selenide, water dikinase SelD [Achromobacter xylosoxidans]